MSTFKKIALVIVVVAALPFILAAFTKKEYAVEREITINRPVAEVFEYIKYLKNQDVYSKWALMDPDMEKTYRGTDGTVGFVAGWNSAKEDVGIGEQEIMAITEGQRIDFQLRFIKPFESTEAAYMTTEAVSSAETKVKWGFDGHMDYPMNLLLLVMDFEKMIGDDLSTGLQNLKSILDAK